MIDVGHLHHLALVCRDLERTRRFYQELFGFVVLPRPPFDFRGAWLYRAGLQIHLIERPSLPDLADRTPDSRGDHIAFHVDDPEVAKATLIDRGVDFVDRVNAGGIRQLFLCDPDGHTIELARHAPPADGWVPPDR